MSNKNQNHGTQEWATKTVNCCTGCSHDCIYCYAKGMAIRFKQLTPVQWPIERIRLKDVDRIYKKYDGQVMFPSSHDITPNNLNACLTALRCLLVVGNKMLVVSKPHLECIKPFCKMFKPYRRRVLLRFSIGAFDDQVLSFWEPNAPAYEERKAALKYAFDAGFQTSVSAEPMIDAQNIDLLVSELIPYITDSFWIGEMNHIGRFSKYVGTQFQRELNRIRTGQTPTALQDIYNRYKDNPMIKWKNGIKKIVGLPMATVPGLDI